MAGVLRSVICIALVGLLGTKALEVVTPQAGLTVVADRTYTVEWTGAPDGRFEIDLYYCGSYCVEGDCGDWLTALCPYGSSGCPDNEGDYDIIMPEPLSGVSGSGYKVRVTEVGVVEDTDCSDEFYLMASEEAPLSGDENGPYLIVTSPVEGDTAVAGEEYTIEWDYDNGVGSRVDRFAIDLYTIAGDGDCGTWVTSICDKESIGCKDSMGDYDVTIPEGLESGMYSIRVGRFDDDSVFGCSGEFEITHDGDGDGASTAYGSGNGMGTVTTSMMTGYGAGYGYGTISGGYGTGSGNGYGTTTVGVTGSGSGSGFGSGSASGYGSAGGSGSASGYGSAGGSGSASGYGSAGGSGSVSGYGSAGGSGSASGYGSAGGSGSASGYGSAGGSGSVGGSGSASGYGSAGGSGSVSGSSSAGGSGSASGYGSAGEDDDKDGDGDDEDDDDDGDDDFDFDLSFSYSYSFSYMYWDSEEYSDLWFYR